MSTASAPAPARPAPARPPASGGTAAILLVVGFVLLSLNTRVAFGQIGPLAPVAGFSNRTVTVLGVIPPLCMGLFAPLAVPARRRFGDERALFAASVVVLAGAVVRMLGMPGLFVGTVVVAAAIAVVNVLIPVFVRTRFAPNRIGVMMGVYALSMGAGSAIVAALIVPVWRAAGQSWPTAIGIAIVPALLAVAGLVPQLNCSAATDPTTTQAPAPKHRVHRTPLAWSLTIFFGLQTLLFYTVLAWLPSILVAAGLAKSSAGGMQALFIVGVSIGGLVVPLLAGMREDQRPHIIGTIILGAAGVVGLLCAPAAAPPVWAVLLGIGLGSGQGLSGVLFTRRGSDHHHVTALSTMAQTVGYLIAAVGPLLASWIHDRTGGWTAPLVTFLVLLAVNAVCSLRAGHDG
ncbi:MFS transporter [Rhodococcus sp. D2-41]|uniref:MFS transporter n=1 Tax=Speluncibacter jeojiensis TaxID=2710754 RepID=UPI002410400C|nr:MFS transporter [Rhodococcus sp. D2-41]MDG3010615.1 MFS transporter [Rhodococcus sp. D2-41]